MNTAMNTVTIDCPNCSATFAVTPVVTSITVTSDFEVASGSGGVATRGVETKIRFADASITHTCPAFNEGS